MSKIIKFKTEIQEAEAIEGFIETDIAKIIKPYDKTRIAKFKSDGMKAAIELRLVTHRRFFWPQPQRLNEREQKGTGITSPEVAAEIIVRLKDDIQPILGTKARKPRVAKTAKPAKIKPAAKPAPAV